jgi:YVTN family beta-propeller protein
LTEAPGYAAIDLGASTGRVVAGRLDRGRIELEVLQRFHNRPVRLPDGLHWNLLALFAEAVEGLRRAKALRGVGFDTWGCDYGLLDGGGRVLGLPFHYRDARTEGMIERAFSRMPQAELSAAEDAVWVAIYGQGDVVRIDPATNKVVSRIHVGGQPEDVAVAAGAVWVPNENGTLARIDPATNTVVATIRVGPDPDYALFCRGRLWVSSLLGPRLFVVDPATNRVVSRVRVGIGGAGMACGRSIWIANYDTGYVLRLDPRRRKVTARVSVGVLPRAVALARGSVWVTNQRTGTVSRVR